MDEANARFLERLMADVERLLARLPAERPALAFRRLVEEQMPIR